MVGAFLERFDLMLYCCKTKTRAMLTSSYNGRALIGGVILVYNYILNLDRGKKTMNTSINLLISISI